MKNHDSIYMNYNEVDSRINASDYDCVISIGNKCPTAMILRELQVYRESYPFDFIPTTPKLILKYFQDQTDFYPTKYTVRTKDDVWFGHFDIGSHYEDTIQTFKRRFMRLFTSLEKKQKILFVYTSEADIYNEMGNRYHDNYKDLCNLMDYIVKKYHYDDCVLLAIHVNKSYENTKHILNYTINVPEKYLSDDMSTHTSEIWTIYRSVLKELLKSVFVISEHS